MLYVFHVDTGTMMTFDMSLALESVNHLKQYVERACKIPADKQVLLVSGGECLDPNARVCSYSAGTDTNPIFLFSKSIIESTTPPCPSVDYGSDAEFKERVKESQDLPPTYNTVVKRAQLAQQFYELAKEQTKICEGLVHDQHLQQQGWSAVVANLEDITAEFRKRSEIFEKSFNDYMKDRDSYLKFLQYFNQDLTTLEKIPVLPALLESGQMLLNENISDDNGAKDVPESESKNTSNTKNISLLEWISSADNKSSMDQLFEHCTRGLEQFDDKIFKTLVAEVEKVLQNADSAQMKEVKGLGDRLFGLEQLMREAKKYVQEQADMAQSFLQNQTRAGNLGDASILPDLCISHRKQLLVMLQNHQQLCDIRRRCTRAKEELSINLYHRLKWVMYIESSILETDQKLVIYHESLRRLRRHLEVLQQIHLAPATYLSAIAEVVRRRVFSQAFLLWASELACHLLTIHNEEVARRKDFQTQFEGHFLNSLFPGMEDLPPTFATQAPSIFDSSLPKITIEDIEHLKNELPELAGHLNVPDTSAITNFFMVKSVLKNELDKVDEAAGVEEKLVQVVSEVGLASNLDHNLLKTTESETVLMANVLPHLKDLDKGCESETDTEEFEKVGQSPLDLHFDKEIPSPKPGTQDVATLTEVGERSPIPPKKPPRLFQKAHIQTHQEDTYLPNTNFQRTLSQSTTESFTNVKNPSLESIDELSSLKNFTSNTESCFNSHHQQMQSYTSQHFLRSKSLSPHTPQSPKDIHMEHVSPISPIQGHQPNEFITDEFYIDESLPSSLSIETGQIQGDVVRQLDTANDVVAMLQDNLQISRSEHEKLKSLLIKMGVLARQTIEQLRNELDEFKQQFLNENSTIKTYYDNLGNAIENLSVERDNHVKELLHKLTIDHELEVSDLRKILEDTSEKIKYLGDQNVCLEKSLEVLSEENLSLKTQLDKVVQEKDKIVEEMNNQIQSTIEEKNRSLKELEDNLNHSHKAEIESIRSRFRLMTMERSPSDSSLEKIERNEIKDMVNHESIVMQMKENFEHEREEAVNLAVRLEKEKWEKILEEKVKELHVKLEEEKELALVEFGKKISEEKDKQIEILRERESNLNQECIKYKSTILQLADCETSSHSSDLLLKLETLEKEKEQLQAELDNAKRIINSSQEMISSVAVCEGKMDASTSPVKSKEKLTSSQTTLIKSGTISTDSCKVGDRVLVLWNPTYMSYTILQESNYLYFLHSDCVKTLGLKVTGNEPRKLYCIGEVSDKEYCHAKKGENRYRVPKGTKFYRIQVKPLPNAKELFASTPVQALQHPAMSQSQTGEASNRMDTSSVSYSLPASPSRTGSALEESTITLHKESEIKSETNEANTEPVR